MDQQNKVLCRKSKRINSNLESLCSNSLSLYNHSARKNPIKINRAKLPLDFFPSQQSSRAKLTKHKSTIKEEPLKFINHRMIDSDRQYNSQDKSLFFNYFKETKTMKNNNHLIQTKLLKRKFETRQQPKRETVTINQRHFTPYTNSYTSDLLQIFTHNQDKKAKQFHLNHNINQKQEQKEQEKPQKLLNPEDSGFFTSRKKEIENKITDPNNITFFNCKSTTLPPVSSKNLRNNH